MKIGKVSESILKRSVLRQLKTKNENVICGAGVGDDCAIFTLGGTKKLASCVQEGVLAVPMQEAEMNVSAADTLYAVYPDAVSIAQLMQKCVNNLAANAAVPFAAAVALLLPDTIEEFQIKALMSEAEKVCHQYSMEIVGGQTRVSAALKAPVAVITTYGMAAGGELQALRPAAPGQDIVLSKWIGLEGTALFAKVYREQLHARYPAYLVEEAAGFNRYLSIVPEAATAVKSGVCAMHDVSEGGIFAALWELAEGAGVGLTIDLKKIPLRQETVEVCECCNVNPYELKSGGCLIMTTEDGPALVKALEAEGIPAAVIGKLTDSNARMIMNEDEVRYMDRPHADEIYKISMT